MENAKYESIKSKLRKLYALAQGGVEGEALNAQYLLDKLCAEYGIKLEDLLEQDKKKWYTFQTGSKKVYKTILFQCYFKVANTRSVDYRNETRASLSL